MTISQNAPLRHLNSFDIDVYAKYFVEINSLKAFDELFSKKTYRDNRVLLLGGGSNILFTHDFDGLIIKNDIKGVEVLREDSENAWIQIGAGENWHDLVIYTLNKNFFGLENLSLIPGSVGAAPIQNIGAYGVEFKDVFHSLKAVNLSSGNTEIFKKEDCQLGYRDSIFKREAKGRYMIYSVTLKLSKIPKTNIGYGTIQNILDEMEVKTPTPQQVSEAVIRIRRSKLPDPNKLPNAGSFFKNPVIPRPQLETLRIPYPDIPYYDIDQARVKVPAGWLIEQCGWKGKRIGHVGVHKNQALVLVNFSNGTGRQIQKLSEEILKSVLDKFGIRLEREVNII